MDFVKHLESVGRENHFEELAHIAEGHVVDDIAEMIRDFGNGIIEKHGDVDPADFGGNFQSVLFAEKVYCD